MEPTLFLFLGAEMGEDLRIPGVGRLVAEDDRSPDRSAFDLVHKAELHLAVTLPAELGRQVRGPQVLAVDLLLQRPDRAHESALVDVQDLEWIDLVVHESPHPLELLLKLGFGREVPGHSRVIPSSIMPTMVSVSCSYMGSGRLPRRCSMRL